MENKLGLEYEDLGKHEVKNISRPIQVYRVLSYPGAAAHRVVQAKETLGRKWRKIGFSAAAVVVIVGVLGFWQFYMRRPTVEPASVEKMAFPLPEKPSIAVLLFDNLSRDESQEYIADGLSENIISSLSQIPDLMVIARNSTFVYKGKAVRVNEVAEELGVKYVLEGSVQKSGENLRVTAQLIDAIKGHHLWSEKYDRATKDFFTVQDDITRNIVIALQVELTQGEQARIWHRTENLEAWGYATKAIALFQHYTKEKNTKARELFERAAELDPNYTAAWIFIAWTHFIDFRFGFSESRSESFKQSVEIIQMASMMGDSLPELHSAWNTIYLAQGQYDKAIAEGKKAIALGPSSATSHILLAMTLHFAGNFKESILHAKEAMRLNPNYPNWNLNVLAISYSMAEKYEKAIASSKNVIERAKMELLSLWRKGTEESIMRAGQVAQEVVDMAPELSVGYRGLAWRHWFLAFIGRSPRGNLKKAYGFALKAISLDEYDSLSHGLLGSVYTSMRQHEKAIAAGKRAIELDPNGAEVHMYLGYTLNFAGRPDEAIEYLNKAIRLNPFPSYVYPDGMGRSYLLKGHYEKVVTEFKKALQLAPMSPPVHVSLAVTYILLGWEEEARASAEKALELAPFISVSLVSKTAPYKNQADLKLILDAMRKAGFPEGA